MIRVSAFLRVVLLMSVVEGWSGEDVQIYNIHNIIQRRRRGLEKSLMTFSSGNFFFISNSRSRDLQHAFDFHSEKAIGKTQYS